MGAYGRTAAPHRFLDNSLKRWLGNVARTWGKPEAETARVLGSFEYANRTRQYPELGEQLRSSPLNKHGVLKLLQGCYIFQHQFAAVRLSNFFNDGRSTSVLLGLVRSFPRSDKEAATRIDRFVERAADVAYKNATGGADHSGAAVLASVLLTSLEPRRFVDFRRRRWKDLAEALNYRFPEIGSYGEWLVQAGRFARALCSTRTFETLLAGPRAVLGARGHLLDGKFAQKAAKDVLATGALPQ
jgi:hypothetical protein